MASGLASIGKRRALENVRERAQESKTASGLASIGKRSDDEKNRGGLIGGLGYVGGNLGLGIAGIGEGVGDLISAGGDLLRGDTDMAKYRFLDNKTAEAQQSLREWYNPGTVMDFAGEVASGLGQSSVFLLDAVAPGVGTGLFFAGVDGQGISSAAARTGDVGWREVGYGVISGLKEVLLEKALGAGSKVAGKLGASITRKAGTAIGQKGITTALTKSAGKRAWSSIAKATAKDAAGEFAEEFASEYIDTALLHAFGIDPNASTSFGEAVRAGMVGLFSGGIMGAPGNVINYKNAAKAGRTIRESGETENLLNRAQATVSVMREQEAVKKAEGKKVKKTDEATEAAEQKGFLARQGAKREARRAAEYAAKLEKNVNAYRNMKAEMRNSEVGDALLGELRGNLYFTNMAYAVEEAEIVLRNVDDAQAQKIVDYINTEAKKAKKEKSDYTVEDFRLNRDGILSQFAAKGRMEQLINGEWTEAEEMAAQAAEATESPVEAAGAAGAVTGEEVDTPEQAAPAEESEAVQAKAETAAELPVDHKARAEKLLRGMGETVGVQKLAEAIDKRMRGEALSVYERSELNENIKAQKVIEQLQRESQQKKATDKAEAKPEAKKQTKGTVTVSDGMKPSKDFSDVQYATYKAAGILSDSLGLSIEIHKSLERNGKIVNGYYDTGTKVLHVNINAMRDGRQIALYTLGHELTHYIKDWSPNKFNALADFVAEQMGTDMDSAVDEKLASLRRLGLLEGKTMEQAAEMAREEVVADGMELILTDGRVLDELAKTDKSLWEKVRDWIFDIIGQIRRSYESLNQASKTAQVLKETMDSLDELERLFTEGVREAGERTRTAGVETVTRMNEENMQDSDRIYSLSKSKEQGLKESLRKLGEKRIRKEAGSKTITILTDEFTANKNIYSSKGRSSNEVNARIKHIPMFDQLIKQSMFDGTDTEIRGLEKEAKKGVVAIHKFVTEADGYSVEILVRDKGDKQYLYEVKFIKTKKDPQQSMTDKSAFPAPEGDAEDGEIIPRIEETVNRKFSISEENSSDIRYSIDETTENADVSENAADTNDGRSKAMTWDEAFGTAVTGSSFRQALAEALEKTIETDLEYKILKDYSENIAKLNNLQKQIDELNATASALREKQFYSTSKEERSSAAKELQSIYERRRKLEDEMARGDSKLERLRQTEPIRNIVRSAERAEKERSKAEEQYKSDRREMSVRERVARRVIGRMNTMFYSPTRTKHVPADLQALVEQVLKSEKLDTFKDTRKNLRQMAELERDIEKLEQNPARTASEQERLDKLHYKYAMLEDEGLDAKGQAEALYTAFKTWMESRPEGQQDKALLDKLSSEIDKMQEMPLSMMSKKSLEAVEDFYKMIYHQVNTANQIYTTERVLYVDDLGGKASQEAQDTKSLKFLSPKAMEIKGKDSIRRFFWKNMKPLTVFEAIGSKTFTGLFQAVLDGEGVWAKDILEARAKIVEAREAHKYKDWDLEKRVEVKTKEGTVKLSLSERMSLYAYSKRESAVNHLEAGGFKLDPNAIAKEQGKVLTVAQIEKKLNDSHRYVLDMQLFGEIEATLSDEQKAYVDEMQTYLTQLGKKGNEVSKKLYGMEIFREEFYFPMRVGEDYLDSNTGPTGDPKIKNLGMTKEVQENAKEPLILQGFDEVMAGHINNMATYHAFVLPVEDLTRVLNYKPANYLRDEKGEVILDDTGKPKADPDAAKDYSTLKAVIEDKYGADAVKYIEQVIRDLNGGARRDAAAGILDRGLTAFKRASTMASLSVLVQQPTSLIRAAAYIDPKYLFGNSTIIDFKNHKELWERVKKYAPVAVIKEMGGYDTGVGTRTADYLNATEYEKGERLKGFVKDENYRAEVFGRGAAYADEMAWIQMFEACVSEQADKLGKSRDSEEVLQAAGKRFEEVIRHTQVYDSTLTRSENMRSKDTGMKMATAFMAEPTTIVSMVAEAIMKAERGDKTFLRNTAAAVAGSIVINSIAASLVYALRDDDEDETYGEKYVSTLAMEVADGFNPLGYLPVARDVVSLMQGYEVERTDMVLIGNLIEQVNMITSSKRSVGDKIFGVSGAVSAFFGVPVTNLYRDAKGAINTVLNSTSPEATTGAGVSAAVKKEFTTIFGLFDKQTTDGYQLYKAYVDGDTAHYNRVKARYEDEKAAEQALRKELRENDRRIGEAAKARIDGETELYESIVRAIVSEGIFDRSMVIRAVNNEISVLERELEKGTLVPEDPEAEDTPEALYKASDLNAALERGDREDFELIYDTILGEKIEQGRTEAQAKASVKSSITAYWKKQYLSGYQDTETRKRIIKLLTDTGLYGSRNDVATMCEGWVRAKK